MLILLCNAKLLCNVILLCNAFLLCNVILVCNVNILYYYIMLIYNAFLYRIDIPPIDINPFHLPEDNFENLEKMWVFSFW